ncbi:mucin-5AC-like protein [Labeo rohita]|uniref:Mucin-5AC-like protein n=1 Tax=Labeo rohita TaxID=84645 RepID=A0A498MVX7_LABRO|nr:mucin-5AC-like protein [Labeo rohita]
MLPSASMPLTGNCDKHMPPLKNGESIHVGNCSIGTCVNGTMERKAVHCDPVQYPVCKNKFPPLKIADESGCCFKYECQCICSGFRDQHYITFDGLYYPFKGNLTYVLVREIDPKYNFSVVVDNVFCDAEDASRPCPKSLMISYKSSEIFMSQRISGGTVINLILNVISHKHIKLVVLKWNQPAMEGVSSQHNGQVCSVWGNYHYKTFDGNYFQLPSSCNYILTSHCSTSYEDFNIQLRHQVVNSEPTISKITMKLQGTLIELAKGSLGVNGQIVTLPFSSSEVFIEKMASYILVKAVFGLEAMWNEDDSFMVKLDEKYTNQTCGLCGDFNGIEVYNEFISDGTTMSVSNYGNLWKMDGPTEVCKEDTVPLVENCGDENFCRDIFSSSVFNDCRGRVSIDSFVQVCMKDLCHCNGTVFDDIHNTGCIPQSECSCVLGGKIFASGENYTSSCRDCTCEHGQWNCIQKDCPQACSIEGGSHITTYDGKAYTFHGDCTYILSKQCTGTEFTVQGDLVKCGLTETETCLKSVTLALLNGTNVIKVDSSGNVEVNRIIAQMPLFTGLCGNFNNIEADDFTTIGGLREGTAVDFANTWKTRASCPDVKRNFENPCSLSTENEKYAQHWCSLLSDPSSVFAPCHSEISPEVYKANCIYDTCNCERSEDCMCAALSSYVHACAARGIALDGWRDVACKTYTLTCPSTMVYSYQMTSCDRTCRSLSQSDNTCAIDFVPVDGCGCAEGTYMNENGDCVAPASCSCYYAGKIIPAGDIIAKDGGSCTCKDRRWTCTTNQCSGTCSIYGDGHYKTFDEKRYVFSGNCEYSLVQDFCNNSTGTFRVITENIPCGSTGTTCSKSIKLFLGSIELRLMDGSYQVVHRDAGEEIPYQMRTMGLYLVIEANNGLMLIWDRKTTIHIKLSPEFNGRVCGLCGNYDGNANNDFTMRSQAIAVETLDFVNSWKLSNCPDATLTEDPCVHNPYREAWAQRQCSIITSSVFSTCHSQGHEYQRIPGQCCGECVSTDCVVMHDNNTVTVSVDQIWQPSNDKCVQYKCERVNGNSVTVEIKTTCPAFNPENCIPGTETIDADGCCQTCTLDTKCNVQKNSTYLVSNGCISSTPVEITSCSGLCETSSM